LDDEEDSLRISKEVLPSLEGFEFAETILGDPEGSLRQFRNSSGVHIREYAEYFEIHKDRFDPRTNPIGHLIRDSPETIAAFGVASLLTGPVTVKKLVDGSALENPFNFFRFFLFFNRWFRILKKLLF
jgi:hypothetical protein